MFMSEYISEGDDKEGTREVLANKYSDSISSVLSFPNINHSLEILN